LAIFLTS
jgi:hypothetical protein